MNTRTRNLVLIMLPVLMLILLAIGYLWWLQDQYIEDIAPNVAIAGVDVSGLTHDEAISTLREKIGTPDCSQVTLIIEEKELTLSAEETGRVYQYIEAVDRAYWHNRGPNGKLNPLQVLFPSAHSIDLELIEYEETVLKNSIGKISDKVALAPVEAQVELVGTSYVASESASGAVLDEKAAFKLITQSLANSLCITKLDLESVAPQTTTDEAELIAEEANMLTAPIIVTFGEQEWSIPPEFLHPWITIVLGVKPSVVITPDIDELTGLIQPWATEVNKEVKNATVAISGNEAVNITPSQTGAQMDIAATTEAIVGQIAARQKGEKPAEVAMVVSTTAPAYTTAQAEEFVNKLAKLSTWTTTYEPNEGNAFDANIHIPAKDLDGYIIMPGNSLDFWDAIGPVTLERGYGMGGVIVDGRSVANGALAGGICSTSTTLFNAALRAGLQIDNRAAHYYYIPRYPVGLDATVWQVGQTEQTMKFTNDTAHPILVRSKTAPGSVTFEIWGVSDGRQVAIAEARTWDERKAADVEEETSDLAPGVRKRAEYPHDGLRASVEVKVTRSSEVLHSYVFESDYKPVDGVTMVGI